MDAVCFEHLGDACRKGEIADADQRGADDSEAVDVTIMHSDKSCQTSQSYMCLDAATERDMY